MIKSLQKWDKVVVKDDISSKNAFSTFRQYIIWIYKKYWAQKCLDTSTPNFVNILRPTCVDSSCKKVYNGNIWTFWYRALCMKTWCSSKSLSILSNFLIYFLGPTFFDTLRLKYLDTSKLKCIESFCE